MGMKPGSRGRPSRLTVVLAFAGAVAAAVALIVVALLFRSGDDAPPPSPTPSLELTGIPQEDRILGDPAARVTLIEWADPQCPACRFYNEEIFPTLVDEYVRRGNAKTEFRGYPFIGADSVKGYRFILAAGLQNRLWNLQDALYRSQGAENSGWVTDDLLRELAHGVAGLDVDKLFADAESEPIVQEAEVAASEAQAAGITGTPSLFVEIGDAEPYFIQVATPDQMRAALDDALRS
ncbi:MAG TPA: thioredoxin domain-containing protein [Gaiellaceae bacterium]|nr:thioredoxin domain-containing protein [Gaiellaceae bacterium]